MTDSSAQTLTTRFLTWHHSNEDLHVRTEARVLFVPRENPDLVGQFKTLRRGQTITVTGLSQYSKTLSSYVLHVKELTLS